ncbi:MAG: UDP-N-acetylmuramoyl-L-alanyl-D-glutamate--2,6-diaminopimelate ligase [bacterium]
MNLEELLKKSSIDAVTLPPENPQITGVSYNSKKIKKSALFFAVKGANFNGEDFAGEAMNKGAAAAVCERTLDCRLPQVIVKDVKTAMAHISEAFYGFPSKVMDVIGITGTNGKTTITYFLEKISEAAGIKSAVFGTVNYRWDGKTINLPNTTAESADLSKYLAEAQKSGVKKVFFEASSQGLDRKCCEALTFRGCVFTNLTHEHLDWHGTFENYAKAKSRLFEILSKNFKEEPLAVINADSVWSPKITRDIPLKTVTYGLSKKADYSAVILSSDSEETVFLVKHGTEQEKVLIRLPGVFNVSNALASFALARETGIDVKDIKAGLANVTDVPGRLTKITSRRDFTVYVDYAHTPDALKNVLKTLKTFCGGRLIVVFGAGGNRDRAKRPEMGEAASRGADFVWLTSDNPRHEKPEDIILDIEVGCRKIAPENFKVEIDRAEAIRNALKMAEKGDIILIAGKGHENYQIFGDEKKPYSDIETVKEILGEIEKT